MHRKMNAKCICKRAVIIIKAEQKSMLRSSSWWMKTKKKQWHGHGNVIDLHFFICFHFYSCTLWMNIPFFLYTWLSYPTFADAVVAAFSGEIWVLILNIFMRESGSRNPSFWIHAFTLYYSTKMLMINTIKCVKISKPYTSTQVPMLFECSMSVDEDFSNVKMWQRNTISLDFCSE